MMKKIPLFIVLGLAVSSGLLSAAADPARVQKAHELYKQGKYSEAGAIYEEALQRYPRSAELHYNLGNVYAKLNRLGAAVAEYEKAKRDRPRDYEINGNLAYLQGLIQYKVDDKRNWYLVQWLKFLDCFSWSEIFFASAVLYFVFILLLGFLLLFRGPAALKKWTRVFWILFLTSVFPLGTKYWDVFLRRDAVVVRDKAEVRYGPSESDKVAFRLAPGLKVNVLETREDWFLVGLVNGESGWCAKKNLEVI
jgi:tetratricopeptide (TPR) repeat protein